jgi:hypothetical protein
MLVELLFRVLLLAPHSLALVPLFPVQAFQLLMYQILV